MKKGSLNSVFGLPTILTVLIVLSILGFASLSLVSANAEAKGLKRSLDLLESTYDAESSALEYFDQVANEYQIIYAYLPIGVNQVAAVNAFALTHPEFEWDGLSFSFTKTVGIYSVKISATISPIHQVRDFILISQTLTIQNDQDYSLDGDPIWKGPQ